MNSVGLRLSAARTACRFVVAGVVFGSAALAYALVAGHTGQPPLAGVVGVTVVVAAALWLLREPIDRLAARVVLGVGADGYAVMRELTAQLAATLPVDEVAPASPKPPATRPAAHEPRFACGWPTAIRGPGPGHPPAR
ncbi:hypothetical protein [Flexivirga alba]|uniref:Uncharacterized protein n=1 Tax=Flexivirga alba TaxID=702742 RepID=A0ABW2ACP6_9MICO